MRSAIIDDNSTIGITVEAVLRKNGSIMAWDSMDKFKDAESFKKAYYEGGVNFYGAIICDHDLGLDQPNGYEIATVLRDSGYQGKLILLTGNDSSSMALRMGATQGVDYVVKNFASKGKNAYDLLSSLLGEARS
ncbi:MAG: response regulator [Sulfurimonas sp.]|jgi:DNA-binding response OmpR family regulator